MASVTLLTSIFNTSSGTKSASGTPSVGDLIVIVTAHTGNTSSAAPTDNQGGTYTQITGAAAAKNSSADQMRVWVRDSLVAAAVSHNFSHAPGTSTGGGIMVFRVSGMGRVGASAVRQSAAQSNQASGGTPTPVLGSAPLSTNALIGAVFNATNPATITPRSGWTEHSDTGYSTPTTGIETMSIDGGETSASIAWGGTSGSAFASTVIELDTSTGAHDECSGPNVLNATAIASILAASLCFHIQQQNDAAPAFEPVGVISQESWSVVPIEIGCAQQPLLADDDIVPQAVLEDEYAWKAEWSRPHIYFHAPSEADDSIADQDQPALEDSVWSDQLWFGAPLVEVVDWPVRGGGSSEAEQPTSVPEETYFWQAQWVQLAAKAFTPSGDGDLPFAPLTTEDAPWITFTTARRQAIFYLPHEDPQVVEPISSGGSTFGASNQFAYRKPVIVYWPQSDEFVQGGVTIDVVQATHTYVAQTPQLKASVQPGQVTHTYTAQTPQVRSRVQTPEATHVYAGLAPSLGSGAGVSVPSTAHSHSAQTPSFLAMLRPAGVQHAYVSQVPQLRATVSANIVQHTYAAQVPQVRARVAVPVATHSYTGRAPTVTEAGAVPPVFGFGARGAIGGAARDPWQRIGTESAQDAHSGIGTESAHATPGKLGNEQA